MELKSNNSNYTKILIDEKFQDYNKNMKRLMFNINNKTRN